MLKKSYSFILILTLFFTLMNSSIVVRADVKRTYSVETVNNITVNANISNEQNFDGEIYFFIKDSTNTKRVFVLNRDNNFSSTYELPIGEANVSGLTIYDKDRATMSLPYTYEGDLKTTADKAAVFSINIDNGSEVKENENTAQSLDSQSKSNSDTEEDSSKNENSIGEKEDTKSNDSSNTSINPKRSIWTIINFIIDVILIIVVGGIVLFIKYREKRKDK